MWWTILTIALVVLCGVFVLGAKMWPGRHTYGQARETEARLWSGLWKREDAERFRDGR